jgi:uncharacterized protein YegP (UPF0339 family)
VTARFEVVATDAGPHLRVVGGNGEPVAATEVYSDERDAVHAVSVIMEAIEALNSGAETIHFVDERTRL